MGLVVGVGWPRRRMGQQMVGEVARGLSLFGGASSEVRRCNCSVVDESRSSLAGLAARCVSFYQTSIYLRRQEDLQPG